MSSLDPARFASGHQTSDILDVAVVGASSAGLFAAELLARAGRRVAVFEGQAELAPARRTLIITPQLKRLLDGALEPAVLHHIRLMAVASPLAAVRIELRDSDLVVERSRFTRLLASRARAAGARLDFGARFARMEPHPAGAMLHFQAADGRAFAVLTRAVVGADGVTSDVALSAGIRRAPSVPIVQAEVELPAGWDPALTQVWFDAADTRFFYWLIPESATRGVVGLVGDERAGTRALLIRFLAGHGCVPLAFQAAQVAMHHPRLRPWGRVGAAPILLVGDAAGQVKVTTVGGTVSGLWGAEAAARALLRGTPYARELRAVKRELDLHWFIRILLDRLDNPGYDRLIGGMPPAIQQFLAHHNRDAMAGVFWHVLVLQPGLVGLSLRLLLRRPPHPYPPAGGPVPVPFK